MTGELLLFDLKRRLNETGSNNDREFVDLLDGALAEYREWIGSVPDPLPDNHREMILSDVVGLFSLSQRGFVEDLDETGARPPVPVVLYPRIRAYGRLRKQSPQATFPLSYVPDRAWL